MAGGSADERSEVGTTRLPYRAWRDAAVGSANERREGSSVDGVDAKELYHTNIFILARS